MQYEVFGATPLKNSLGHECGHPCETVVLLVLSLTFSFSDLSFKPSVSIGIVPCSLGSLGFVNY